MSLSMYHASVPLFVRALTNLHHVLKLERYAPLAETPHGHVLAPGDSNSLPLIRQWFAEIDTMFPGPFIHIGADETFELARGQTAARVQSEGIGAVYLGFLAEFVQAAPGSVVMGLGVIER